MGQRYRFDQVDQRYHVMNRGVAKRTIAENARDAACFFEHLTAVVEAGLITVEAAVLMTTHFHLILRSLTGEFWRAMRQFQNGYSRAFNRARRRDGPLFRGRFKSKLVDHDLYWLNLVRYIDHNPVSAGMVALPEDYPFGSAAAFVHGTDAPWLDRGPVERYVRDWHGKATFDAADYRAVFGSPAPAPELIERRIDGSAGGHDALARLLPASPGRTRDWMMWKATLADGTAVGDPVCSPGTVDALIALACAHEPKASVRLSRESTPVWPLLRIGLLRTACGLRVSAVARRLGGRQSTTYRRARMHEELVRKDPGYAARAASIVSRALEIDWQAQPTAGSPG